MAEIERPPASEAAEDALAPADFDSAAAVLAGAAESGTPVRIVGGATKLGWGGPCRASVRLCTRALDRSLEHNPGDLTASFSAGVPLARAQAELAEHGQRLALDPPLAPGRGDLPAATIGGVFATADSGPLRHRYGLPRDLILGVTLALSDGTVASAGGKVIKNVAGYDLAKLATGSFGTLGLILSVNVRLHPLPVATATALGSAVAPGTLSEAAVLLAQAPLELEALDVAWRAGRGGLLAQVAGPEARRRAERAASLMRSAGLQSIDVTEQDAGLWARQRAGQRSTGGALVRVGLRPTMLVSVLRAADAAAATLVGRAAHGTYYLQLQAEALGRLMAGLPEAAAAVVLDLGDGGAARSGSGEGPAVERFSPPDAAALELMRAVKRSFDPADVCNPGVFVGGI